MDCSTPGLPVHHNSQSLLKLMSIELVMPSNHLILCLPLLLLPSIFPSIRVFSNESVLCIRWPKYYSFNFSISPSNECSGLISFRMDWLDLLRVPLLNSLQEPLPVGHLLPGGTLTDVRSHFPFIHIFMYVFYLCIYRAAPGLGCVTWDL